MISRAALRARPAASLRALGAGAFSLVASVASVASAQQRATLDDSTVRAIDALFADHAAPGSPGCAVGVYRDGAVRFARGYGAANLTFGVPITPDTRFTVGSVSKQFTAASIALLVRAGRISLDDDVRRYVPELPEPGAPILVRHLVHHTSGLRDFWALATLAGWRLDDGYATRDMLALAAAQRGLNNVPGTAYAYSNTGYLVLGEIVRRVTGQSLRAFADSAIFRPLGMRDSFFLDDHNEVVAGRATAYSPVAGGWTVNVWNNDLVGQGGLVTTLADLQRWDENFYSHRIGGDAFVALQRTTEPLTSGAANDYAFGITMGAYRGMRLEEHTGSTGGYRAALYRWPEAHTSVALLCNASDVRNADLPLRVADLVLAGRLGARPAGAAAASVAPSRRAAVSPAPGAGSPEVAAGRYVSAELLGTVWEVGAGPQGTVSVRRPRGDILTFRPAGGRTYVSPAGITMEFTGAPSSQADGFTVTQGVVTGVRFERVAPR